MTEEEVVGQVVASREEGEAEAMVAEVEAMVGVEAEEVLPDLHPLRYSVGVNASGRFAIAAASMQAFAVFPRSKESFVS